MIQVSALSNPQLDAAYAASFDNGDMAAASMYGDEIVRRHFGSIGDFFTFDFFARNFPLYNVRVNTASVLSTASVATSQTAQKVADAGGAVVDTVKSAAFIGGAAVFLLVGFGVYVYFGRK